MGSREQYSGWYSGAEGPDGAGKSLLMQHAKAYDEAEGLNSLFIREPGTGEFGEEIREYLLHKAQYDFSPQTEYALFTANRAHIVSDVILPALKEGRRVITDRRIESSGAMQGGRAGALAARQKGWETSLTTEQIFAIGRMLLPDFYMRPDGLVLLSLSKAVRRERMRAKAATIGTDKFESRTPEYSDAVHDGYIEFETTLPYVTVINAEQDPIEVFKQARPILFGPDHA